MFYYFVLWHTYIIYLLISFFKSYQNNILYRRHRCQCRRRRRRCDVVIVRWITRIS